MTATSSCIMILTIVADPFHFDMDPDPDPRIRLQIRPKIGKIFRKKCMIFSWFWLISVEIFHNLGLFFATRIQIRQKWKRIRIRNTDFNYSDYIRIFALYMVYKFFRCIKGLITNFLFFFSKFQILHEAYIWTITPDPGIT